MALLALMIFIDAWQVIPSVMIILLAGLQNIPEETEKRAMYLAAIIFTVLRQDHTADAETDHPNSSDSEADFSHSDLVDHRISAWFFTDAGIWSNGSSTTTRKWMG